MGVLAVLVVLAGFGPVFLGVATGSRSMSGLVQVHTIVFASWLVLFIVQSFLIKNRAVNLHRRLGMVTAGIAMAVLIVGYMTAIAGARRGFDLGGKADGFAYAVFPLGDLVSFALLVSLGVIFRRRPEVHKRLMLLATIGALMNAPLAHLIAHTPALRDFKGPPVILPMMLILYFTGAIHDKLKFGRIHPVSLWGAVLLFAWGNLRAVVIYPTKAWQDFVEMLAR